MPRRRRCSNTSAKAARWLWPAIRRSTTNGGAAARQPPAAARAEGKGRILYIPQIVRAEARASRAAGDDLEPEPGATVRRGERMSPAQWVLPKNHQEIYDAIAGGLPEGLSITTQAPLTTVMELLNPGQDTRDHRPFSSTSTAGARRPRSRRRSASSSPGR